MTVRPKPVVRREAGARRNSARALAALLLRDAFKEQRRLIADTIVLGVVGALSAQVFSFLVRLAGSVFLTRLGGYAPPGLPSETGPVAEAIGAHGLWLIPVATTLGGLLTGLLVYTFAPEAEGHGTDSVVRAFHQAGGYLRGVVAPVKTIASAITIGSGGAAGREGPTALISASIASAYAGLFKRSEEERRLLVLIGMASGLAAIFRSPVGTAIFAIEVLYGGMEFEAGALLYTMLGSVIAYAINGLFVGYGPLFRVPQNLPAPSFMDYPGYVALGVAAGLIAILLPMVFYSIRDAFRALPVPRHVKPAIGGLATGLLALEYRQILGGGYGWIQAAIDGRMAAGTMLALVFVGILAMSLTISSGGSGGVFAPTLFIGAMLGGFLASAFGQPAAPWVVIGMAAVFGGTAHVPIATLLMVTEMTGGYSLLVPTALAVMLSYLIQTGLSARLRYRSLYEAQVRGSADSPAHHAEQLKAAIHLLGLRGVRVPPEIGRLDLTALLGSGIGLDLPDGRQLLLGSLKPESSWVGKPIDASFTLDAPEDVEIVAVFRDGHTLLPHTGLKLQRGDRLLALASPGGHEKLEQHLVTSNGSKPES